MPKEIVEALADYISIEDITGHADDVLQTITDKINKLRDNDWDDLYLKDDGCYDGFNVNIYGYRIETDEEYDTRMKKTQKHLQNKKNQLSRLEEKYNKLKVEIEEAEKYE